MDIVNESREYALSEIEKYGTPIPIHFEISEKKALELADKLKADKKIVQIGIYLMDLKLGQALKEKRQSEHVKMSVQAAEEFLNKFKLKDKDKIINCIEAHHKDVHFKCIEAEICANADCYRIIHPKGFFAYLMLLNNRGLTFYDVLEQAEKKLEEKHNILSLDMCKKELENVAGSRVLFSQILEGIDF